MTMGFLKMVPALFPDQFPVGMGFIVVFSRGWSIIHHIGGGIHHIGGGGGSIDVGVMRPILTRAGSFA